MRLVAGSTLVELLVVLALIAICAIATFPVARFFSAQLVRASLESLAERCTFLQQKAIIGGKQIELVIDQQANAYIIDESLFSFGPHVAIGVLPGVAGPPSRPMQQILNPITFSKNSIIFYPDGTMQSGALYLTSFARDCLYALTIPIGQTSCIRCYRWQDSWELIS